MTEVEESDCRLPPKIGGWYISRIPVKLAASTLSFWDGFQTRQSGERIGLKEPQNEQF